MPTKADLVRRFFAAYAERDRASAESILADDYTFTSPYDQQIDKKTFFERCWPRPDNFRAMTLEKVVEDGGDVMIRYRVDLTDGPSFHNMELLKVDGERIKSTCVAFEALPKAEPALKVNLKPVERGAAHERLKVFAGKWRTEGRAFDSPFGQAAPINATETYEWLTGGTILVHRLEGKLGDHHMACVETIAVDPTAVSGEYVVATFYDNGTSNIWKLEEQKAGAWILSGEWGEQSVRCLISFEDGGKSRRGNWEYSADGKLWKTFWETKLTKIN